MATATADLARPAELPSLADARKATAAIKRQLQDVQRRSDDLVDLVRQARTGGVWAALGYDDWDGYVRAEFAELSRGQKHRLSVWSAVLPELEEAAGGPVALTGRQAAKAKKAGASQVADRVRERLVGRPDATPEERRQAVEAALAEPIEATATPIASERPATPSQTPVAATEPVAAPTVPGPPSEAQAGAESTTVEPSAGALLAVLLGFAPDDAAETVEVDQLDRLQAWTGLVRAAIRRRPRPAPEPATVPPRPVAVPVVLPGAPGPWPEPVEPPRARAAVMPSEPKADPAPCDHPANRRLGPTCTACGSVVK